MWDSSTSGWTKWSGPQEGRGDIIDHNERLYSDEEVARLLKVATELQAEAGTGLSLSALTEIAEEIAVDAVYVERAASSLEGRLRARPKLWGGPLRYDAQLTSTHEMSPDGLVGLVGVIRGATQHHGVVQEVLGSLEWKSIGQVNEIAVTATATRNGTHVRVVANRLDAAAMIWGFTVSVGLLAGAITGAILSPGVLGGIGIMAAGLTAGLTVGRATWARSTREFRRHFENLRARLSKHLEDADEHR